MALAFNIQIDKDVVRRILAHHGKGERRIRPRHDQQPISARFDGNPTVGPSIRHRSLPD
jgi:hypothetical protein